MPDHPSPYFGVGHPLYEAPHEGMRVNPNVIGTQSLELRIPANPAVAGSPTDTSLGPIGMATNGVPLFNQYARDNAPLDQEIESFDRYNGHPTGRSLYHYHIEPFFLTEGNRAALVGFLLDGFPLYGPDEDDGSAPTGLDDCNGHTHAAPEFPDGIYHYHVVDVPPYFTGCYAGTPGTWSN